MYYLLFILLVISSVTRAHELVESALPAWYEELVRKPDLLLTRNDVSLLQSLLSEECYAKLCTSARAFFLPLLYQDLNLNQFNIPTCRKRAEIGNNGCIRRMLLVNSEIGSSITNIANVPIEMGLSLTFPFCWLSPSEQFYLVQTAEGYITKAVIETIQAGRPFRPLFVAEVPHAVTKCSISNDEQSALCSTAEGIYVIDLNRTVAHKLPLPIVSPHSLTFHPSKSIALVASDTCLSLIDLRDPEDPRVKSFPVVPLKQAAFSADGSSILSYTEAGMVLAQKLNPTDCSLGEVKNLIQLSSELRFTHDKRFAYVLLTQSVYLFDLSSFDKDDLIIPIELRVKSPATCLSVTNDGNFVIMGSSNGTIELWSLDWAGQSEAQLKVILAVRDCSIRSLDLSEDDSRVVFTTRNDDVSVLALPRFDTLVHLVDGAKEMIRLPRCEGCGLTERALGTKLFTCSGCRSVKYCSRDCQKDDWKKHKSMCKKSS